MTRIHRWLVVVLGLSPLLACSSSARYTVPAAAVNTAVAVGAAAVQRSEGRCIAVCTPGHTCNPRTGLCEKQPGPNEYCQEAPGGGVRCVPLDVRATREGEAKAPAATGVGFTPAAAPPAPADASPRRP